MRRFFRRRVASLVFQTASNEVNASVTPEDVTKMLRSKRVNSKTTPDIADAIAASLNGQELTKTQRKRLSSALGSPAVQSVISDMQKTLTSRSGKVSQNPTARNVGQLYTTVQTANDQANAPFNQEDVAKRLMEKGFNPEKSEKMADAIAARLNDQKLTKIQTDRLRAATDNAVVRDVISDITKKKADGIDSVQNDVYDKIKTPGGNAVTENSASRQEQNATLEGTDEGGTVVKKPYATSRPSYGKGQIEQVWENAKDPITGKVYDPSGVEITWDPTKSRNGQWDMGHMPDAKYSVMHKLYMDDLMSLNDFLAWYRNPANYRPELPSTNRSHKYE